MKAAVCESHGKPEGLYINEVAKPTLEKNEILVKIVASTVTAGDVVLRKQTFSNISCFGLWPECYSA